MPTTTGRELDSLRIALASGYNLSGGGGFSKQCQRLLCSPVGAAFMTASGSLALDLAAALLRLKPGDEVIMPSYTYPTAASAIVRAGAHVVFADSLPDSPHLDLRDAERLITAKTVALMINHYGGWMRHAHEAIAFAENHGLKLLCDAAHAAGATSGDFSASDIGHAVCFSFHASKNVQCGEGGMLVVNNSEWHDLANRLWMEGTNRPAFLTGELSNYSWTEAATSSQCGELAAAYLLPQLDDLSQITATRLKWWYMYSAAFSKQSRWLCAAAERGHNGHIFWLSATNGADARSVIDALAERGIEASSHYVPLHLSPLGSALHRGSRPLPMAERWGKSLFRLPLHHGLAEAEVCRVIEELNSLLG